MAHILLRPPPYSPTDIDLEGKSSIFLVLSNKPGQEHPKPPDTDSDTTICPFPGPWNNRERPESITKAIRAIRQTCRVLLGTIAVLFLILFAVGIVAGIYCTIRDALKGGKSESDPND